MTVKVINKSENKLPEYATPGSAGIDLRASILEPITLEPMKRVLVPTDLYMKIPEGYELQVRPRSGLALKQGITVINTPGTIDSDYIDNVGVILINLSEDPYIISPGDRIAQAVLNKIEQIEWEEVKTLDKTNRKGGFGSTGI